MFPRMDTNNSDDNELGYDADTSDSENNDTPTKKTTKRRGYRKLNRSEFASLAKTLQERNGRPFLLFERKVNPTPAPSSTPLPFVKK